MNNPMLAALEVFEKVQSGELSMSEFLRYVIDTRSESYNDGYDQGHSDAKIGMKV